MRLPRLSHTARRIRRYLFITTLSAAQITAIGYLPAILATPIVLATSTLIAIATYIWGEDQGHATARATRKEHHAPPPR